MPELEEMATRTSGRPVLLQHRSDGRMNGKVATPKLARAIDLAVVLLLAALGVALALQGWRSRVPSTDVVPYIDGAHALLSHGRLPDHGVVTSFASFAPPGLAWVVLPGVSLFSDPRLFDVPGNAILYLGTLVGIFLLARACFGARCARLSVLLYGVSELGVTFAGSFGPRGHPLFYVWMTYWICWWVASRDARYLALALMTWLTGMYVFMEIAPAVIGLLVVWVIYRPPVSLRALAVPVGLAVLMWYPYLHFESTRGFVDIRSQVLLENIAPATYAEALCDPTLTLRRWEGSSAEPLAADIPQPSAQTRALMWLGLRALAMASGLVINFQGVVAGTGLALLALTLAGLLVAVNVRQRRTPPDECDTSERVGVFRKWPTRALAIGLLVGSALANEVVIGRALGPDARLGPFATSTLRTLQAMAALAGLALLTRRSIDRSLRTLATRLTSAACDPTVLVLCLVMPWAVLFLISEWGRQDRFQGLWALQVIGLAFLWTTLLGRSGGTRLARAGLLLTIAVIAINPFSLSRLKSWHQEGWSGADAIEIRVADHLARRLRAEGGDRAAVGYRLFIEGPPQSPPRSVDDRWRIGHELDVILEFRHGIVNLDTCGEGLAARDEYRIVEAYPPTSERTHYYFDVPSAGSFHLLDQIGSYQLYKRD